MAVACHSVSTGRDASSWDMAFWGLLLALCLPCSGRRTLQLHNKVIFLLELIRSEVRVVVSIGEIKGVPDPSAHQQLEVSSEFPVTTYSYCVTYEFEEGEEIEDSSSTEVCA